MSSIEIKKCDICGNEERSDDPPKYWSQYHSGKIEINFRSAPNLQSDLSKNNLCHDCAKDLHSIIVDAIIFIKNER